MTNARISEIYDTDEATVREWIGRGAPVQDPVELAKWAMNEPVVYEGYKRNAAVADLLPRIAGRALASDDVDFARLVSHAFSGWLSTPQCHAFWSRR